MEMVIVLNHHTLMVMGLLIAGIVSTIFIILSYFLVLRDPYAEKNSAYECGFQPFSDARVPFDIHFYLVCLLFLIFDLEFMFLLPWLASFMFMTAFNYSIILIFLIILTIGFIYEWKIGALNW